MRWIVVALLAANLGLLGWNLQTQGAVAPPPPPPAGDRGALPLLSEIGEEALRTRAGASAETPRATAPELAAAPAADTETPVADIDPATKDLEDMPAPPAPPRRTCLALGPLAEDAPVDAVTAWLRERGADVDVRSDERREVALYWVYFPPRASREAAVEEVVRMRDAGIDDIIVVPKGDMANAISLGVFSRTDTRDRRLKELNALGYEPQVSPRYRTSVATWIDVAAEQGTLEGDAVAARWPELPVTAQTCAGEQIAAGGAASYNSPSTGPAPRRFHFSGSDAR